MTIYTHSTTEKKDDGDLKSPMVVEDVPDLDLKKKTIDDEDVLLPQPAAIIIARRRRTRTLAQFCLLFTAVFVLALGVMTGIYLYKHFSKKLYIGRCGVKDYDYNHNSYEFQEAIQTDQQNYERIDVPAIRDFREATILHDFDKNYTAIIDKRSLRCYVMPLNYALVQPPKDFWDLISKIQSGYYLPNEKVIRENYEVVEPPVHDLQPFGFYIWSECNSIDTYRMIQIQGEPTAMVKRSACIQDHFMVNSGRANVDYNIVKC